MKHKPPFFTPIEIIRTISNALNIKLRNKLLDDNALNLHIDYQKINKIIDESIKKHIKKYIDNDFADAISNQIQDLTTNYLTIVSTIDAYGVNRSQSTQILFELYFADNFAYFLNETLKQKYKLKPIEFIVQKDNAVNIFLNWLETNESNWNKVKQKYSKDLQDKISSWKRGEHLPSIGQITLLEKEDETNLQINWQRLKVLLLTSRVIDYFRKRTNNDALDALKINLMGAKVKSLKCAILDLKHKNHAQKYLDINRLMIEHIIPNLLGEKSKKNTKAEHILKAIKLARDITKRVDSRGELDFFIDWQEARWCVFSGKLEQACDLYKKAFEGCLYRAGDKQKLIIAESLIIAASQKRPDKVFLKKLKNSQITFGYDVVISHQEHSTKIKYEDVMQDWELEAFKKDFKIVFPKNSFFDGVEYPNISTRTGPVSYIIDEIKPDYKRPNKKIKAGEWRKMYPQIVWFSQTNKVNIVRKLLDKGADINVLSESNESAISLALGHMSVFDIKPPENDEMFNIISKHKHRKKILNIRTSKKKLLPIILAVETGMPNIVKKVLEIGADPNILGGTDEQSALNVCIKYIILLKAPNITNHIIKNNSAASLEALDSKMRYMGGMYGHNLENQKNIESNSEFNDMLLKVTDLCEKNIKEYAVLANFYEIAEMLLNNGANPNQENFYPIKGYTPLMLAAESNEAGLFKLMLKKGGCWDKTYKHPTTLKKINCLDIAKYFKSHDVQNILN